MIIEIPNKFLTLPYDILCLIDQIRIPKAKLLFKRQMITYFFQYLISFAQSGFIICQSFFVFTICLSDNIIKKTSPFCLIAINDIHKTWRKNDQGRKHGNITV